MAIKPSTREMMLREYSNGSSRVTSSNFSGFQGMLNSFGKEIFTMEHRGDYYSLLEDEDGEYVFIFPSFAFTGTPSLTRIQISRNHDELVSLRDTIIRRYSYCGDEDSVINFINQLTWASSIDSISKINEFMTECNNFFLSKENMKGVEEVKLESMRPRNEVYEFFQTNPEIRDYSKGFMQGEFYILITAEDKKSLLEKWDRFNGVTNGLQSKSSTNKGKSNRRS